VTFDEIVAEVCDRLNYTSPDAITRVGKRVNERYKRLTSSIGLELSRRTQISTTASIGSALLTFTSTEKVLAVVDKTSGTDVTLTQITPDEMHIIPIRSQPPRHYCIMSMTATSVTITVDCVATTGYTIYADIEAIASTLVTTATPGFSESFHDILVYGAMADEYKKMEKPQLAQMSEQDYEHRLSDLRMWIAKSAYLDITQGKYTASGLLWNRNTQVAWSN